MKFLKIYSFFLIFLLAVSIGRGFLVLWFIQNSFTYSQVVLYFLFAFAVPSLILLFPQRFSTTKSFTLALVSEILLMLTVLHFYHHLQIYLAGILAGATVIFFYVTYNTLFFENTAKERRATSSSLFTLAIPFSAIVIPLAGGSLGQKYGLPSLFLLAILILLLTFFFIRFLPKIEFNSNLRQSLAKTSRINFLLFLEGIKESTTIMAIPLFTLFFIRQPLPYGIFLSYLAILSSVATILLGILSDKFKKRKIVLYPITFLVAISIIGLGFSQSLISWAIISGVLGFTSTINSAFVTTLVLDQVLEVEKAMIAREFLLNVGRVSGIIIIFTSLTLADSPKMALILIGFLYLLFPTTVYLKKIYLS